MLNKFRLVNWICSLSHFYCFCQLFFYPQNRGQEMKSKNVTFSFVAVLLRRLHGKHWQTKSLGLVVRAFDRKWVPFLGQESREKLNIWARDFCTGHWTLTTWVEGKSSVSPTREQGFVKTSLEEECTLTTFSLVSDHQCLLVIQVSVSQSAETSSPCPPNHRWLRKKNIQTDH